MLSLQSRAIFFLEIHSEALAPLQNLSSSTIKSASHTLQWVKHTDLNPCTDFDSFHQRVGSEIYDIESVMSTCIIMMTICYQSMFVSMYLRSVYDHAKDFKQFVHDNLLQRNSVLNKYVDKLQDTSQLEETI